MKTNQEVTLDKRTSMDEQLLKDLVATAQADNYNWDVVSEKFPELKEYDVQLLKDYVATAEKDEYDYSNINSKFPEFGFESEITKEETLEPGGGVLAYEPEKEKEEVVLDSEVVDFKPEDGVLRLEKDIEEVPDEDRVYEEDIVYMDLKSPITPEIKQTERGNFYLNKDGKNYKLIRTANKDLINFDPMEGRERMEDAEFSADDFQKDVEEVDKRAQYIEQMSEDEKKPAWEQLGYDSANDYYEYIADQDPGSIEAYKVLAPIGWALDKEARIARSVLSTVKGAQEFSNMVEVNKMAIADHILTSALGSDSQLKGDVLNLIDKTKFIHGGPITAIPKDILESTIEEGSDLIWQRDDSIVDAIGEEGFFSLEVADRIIGGVAESIPSLLLAAAGPGGIAVLGASAAGNKFEELVEENPDEALSTLTFNALGTGITEATFELVTRGIWKRAKGLMGAGDTRAAKALIDSYGKQVLKRLAVDPLAEGFSEAATEFSTSLIDLLTFNDFKDVNFYKWFGDNVKNWADAGIIGFFTGGGITSGGLLSSNKQSVVNAAEYTLTPTSDRKVMMDAAIQINDLNEQLKQSYDKSSRDIIEAKIVQEEAKIINTKNKVSQELRMMNPNELKSYAKNIDEINSLNKKLRKSNPQTVKQAHIDRLSELETENEFYIREAVDRRLDENIKTVGVEDLGRTVNDYNSKEKYQKAYNNTEEGKKNSMNVTSSDGFISEDGDIYINREVAQKVRNVNVAAHELLHGILNNNIKEPGQLKKLVNEFKAILPRDVANSIQKRIDDNYRFETDEQGNRVERPESEYMEEYFTAFADLIGNRQVKFNENIFTKIGEKITPIFKGKGYGHIKFETGKDVYNFIKDYQKQIAKGELKPETIEAAKKVTDKDTKEQDVKTQLSKTETTDVKGIDSKRVQTMVDKVANRAWTKFGKPIPANIKQKAGVTRQSYIESAKTELAGIAKEFDPTKKDKDGNPIDFDRFMANRGMQRMNSLAARLGIESAEKPTSKRLGQAVQEGEKEFDIKSEDPTPEEVMISKEDESKTRKGIKLADRLGDDAKKISEKVKKMKPVLEGKTYKTLKDLAPDDTQRMFGIKPKPGNLTKEDVKNAQQFINKNADILLAMLPEGTTVSGKATGVQKVLLDPFYNKGRRVKAAKTGSTAGLATQNKKPNIKISEFKEVFGITPAGQPNISDRNTSARIKALVDQTGKLLTNQAIREVTPDAPTAIKEGKSKVMFSASTINNSGRDFLKQKNLKEFTFNFENKKFTYKVNKGALRNTDETAVKYYQYVTQELLPKYLPISDLVNSNNYASRSDKYGRGHFMTGEERKSIVKKAIKNERNFTERERRIVKKAVQQKAFYKTKNGKRIGIDFNTKEYKEGVKDNYDGGEYINFQLQEMVKDYPETALYVAAFFNSASGNSGHYIRQLAIPQGVDKGFVDAGFVGEKEHIWQQNQAAEVMYNDIINQKVKDNFQLIRDNYFMLGISNTNNNKLKDLSGKYGPRYNYGNIPPPIFVESLINALNSNDLSKAKSIWIRYFNNLVNNNNGGMNPNLLTFEGKSVAELFNVSVDKKYHLYPDVINIQNKLIEAQLLGKDVKPKQVMYYYTKNLAVSKNKALAFSKSVVEDSGVVKMSKDSNSENTINQASVIDKALRIARDPKAPIKKIRVFDFDDTLARTKSNVLYTMPDGTTGKLTAEEFAKKGDEMLAEGAVWDFSEFNKVMDGKKGPLFEVAKKIQEARGTQDVFVLTARAPEASTAIKEFLDAIGLNIPLKNITGLGDSSPYAKSNWIVDKAAEGYNDFYFADDQKSNIKAVRDALEVIDVKSKTQQAKIKFSKSLNEDFNNIIEESTGIDKFKIYSDIKAEIRGAKARKQRFFIPPSAEDFLGLLYTTLPKGLKGEKALAFYKKSLLDPYSKAMENLSTDRINLMNDFKALKKELDVPKDLQKQTESGFTNEQAVRVYLWNKIGEDIPGLSKSDLKELNDIVENNPKLKVFADQILAITKGDGYSTPTRNWATGTITTDLIDVLNTTKRSKYLETWKQNVDIIFSKDNLNKLEAAFGKSYREAVENSLSRMKSGSNRVAGGNKLSNQILDYINNSTAVTMFMNTRSAILQTISAANFINWSFNSPYHAGKAFANQPQYWKDFIKLMNSDYLVDRRNGLKLNINESEIANAAKTSKNKAKAALNYILEKGYLPTKFADSFAIASGGATWYRNKIKDLMKDGLLTEKEAEVQAMKEFRDISEMSQQSSDPSKISSQQSSDLGRIILQYVNTPMQYARLQKRDIQDTVNGRRIPGKTLAQSNRVRASRIAYYMFLQNLAFNALQQGLFAIGFGDDEIDEKEEEKLFDAANGMLDSSLRGLGLAGVTIQVIKNLGIDIYDRSKKKRPEYSDSWIKLLEFSPAIKTKLSKLRSAAWPFDTKKRRAEVFEKGFSLDNPAYESMAKVISATSNVPLDRLYGKINNIKAAFSDEAEAWQSLAMVLGWPEWQIMDDKKTKSKSKSSSKGGYKRKSGRAAR
jgi:hypothetical protein